jgi:hypothetical protein
MRAHILENSVIAVGRFSRPLLAALGEKLNANCLRLGAMVWIKRKTVLHMMAGRAQSD